MWIASQSDQSSIFSLTLIYDFGVSPRIIAVRLGSQDHWVPEMLMPHIPYDPFKAIYQLRNTILNIISVWFFCLHFMMWCLWQPRIMRGLNCSRSFRGPGILGQVVTLLLLLFLRPLAVQPTLWYSSVNR